MLEHLGATLGLPVLAVAILAALIIAVRAGVRLMAEQRASLATDELRRLVEHRDAQLRDFYLPIRERLKTSEDIFTFAKTLKLSGSYDNDTLGIVSSNPHALRNIVVRRVFQPLNRDLERLLLDNTHLRAPDDDTNYTAILRHLILWRALEEECASGGIEDYSGRHVLEFPAAEVAHFNRICDRLVGARNELRSQLLRFSTATSKEVK